VIALDTSTLIAYLEGGDGPDILAADEAIHMRAAALPPVVLTELLSSTQLDNETRITLAALPRLALDDDFWVRAGLLRASLHSRKLKARLADTLIAQSCLDHDVALITRDRDFRHFAAHAGLRLIPAGR
jgi:predicted nucleic acid-binding protein